MTTGKNSPGPGSHGGLWQANGATALRIGAEVAMYAIFYAALLLIALLCSATLVWNDPDRRSRL